MMVKYKGKVVPVQSMKAYRGNGIRPTQLHSFLNSALGKAAWSTSRSGRITDADGRAVPVEHETGWDSGTVQTIYRRKPYWLSRNSNRHSPYRSLVTIRTVISKFQKPWSTKLFRPDECRQSCQIQDDDKGRSFRVHDKDKIRTKSLLSGLLDGNKIASLS